MSDKVVELIKYPVTVMSVLVAIVVAKYLGIAELNLPGGGGVKFREGTTASLAALDAKVAEIDARRKAGEGKVTKEEAAQEVFAAAQTVSDQTAQLARLDRAEKREGPLGGYIWIGNYRNTWKPAELSASQAGPPITTPPARLQAGEDYYVLGNMVIRGSLPKNDEAYYRGVEVVGAAPKGTKVHLLATPTGIDRQFSMQYWANVEVR